MVNSTEVNLKLKKLNETQDSIVATSKWIFANSVKEPSTFDVILFTISSYLNSADPQYQVSNKKKLTLVYLLNDLSHLIKFKHADKAEFVQTLDEQIPNLINETMSSVPGDIQQKIVRVVKIWKQRKVYPEKVLSQINTSVQETPTTADNAEALKSSADKTVKELKVINDIYIKYNNTGSTSLDLKREVIRNLESLIAKEKKEYFDMKRKETALKNKSSVKPVSAQQPLISSGSTTSAVEEIPTYAASSSSDSDSDAETQEKETEKDGQDAANAGTSTKNKIEAESTSADQNAIMEPANEIKENLEEYNPEEQQRAQKKPKLDAPSHVNAAVSSPPATQKPVLLTSNIQDLLNKLSQSKK
ncbi:hypothetical protein ACO0QE_000482 [Hanseniaspora vineae]